LNTALHKRCVDAIKLFCIKRKIKLTHKPRHLFPRAYVVAKPAPMVLVIVRPWVDAEKQCRDSNKHSGGCLVRVFDEALNIGDWCTTAYIVTSGRSEEVAIPVVT